MNFLFDGPTTASATVVLAHGAGAGMDSPFMAFFAEGLAANGLRVVRFEFPYMAQRRTTGKQRPPDREPVLRDTLLAVIEQFGAKNLVIGGKSMGARIASLVADEAGVAGLVCLGYPFHPTGRPDKLRVDPLAWRFRWRIARLAIVSRAWPTLPEALRDDILRMIREARGDK